METKLLKLEEKVLSNYKLSEDEQCALFEHPQAAKLLKVYVREHYLCGKAEVKMLEQRKAKKLLQIYVKKYCLEVEAL